LLLERVLPGTRLADEPDPWPLTEVAPVLSQLWQEPPELNDGYELPDLRDRAEFVFDITRRRLDRHPEVAARVPPGLVEGSQRRAAALAGEGPIRVLHGDLHAGNVLRGGDGLVTIDPRPCLGDPAFDAVDWVLAGGGSEHAVRHRIDWLAGRVGGLDPDRAWAWCQATAVVIAVTLLIGRRSDRAGEKMLNIARSAVE
jgi:streptomycin 6-kinase